MVNSKSNIEFGLSKKTNLSSDCLKCDVREYCNGGCPKHRFELSSSGKPNHNYLCPAYKSHLHHSLDIMKDIVHVITSYSIHYTKLYEPGTPPGDQHVVLRVVVPEPANAADEALYEQMARQMPIDPRTSLDR